MRFYYWCLRELTFRALHRRVKFWWQRHTRGFDDSETWGLDSTIAKFALPRLRVFRKRGPLGYPPDLTFEEWQHILDEIIWFLEWHHDRDTIDMIKEEWPRYEAAGQLFGKYFGHLWD